MRSELTVRTATPQDDSEVRRLLRELDDHHVRIRPDVFQTFDDTECLRERFSRFVNVEEAELFVAEVDDTLVGLATVGVMESPAAPMFRRVRYARMDDLVVDPELRGAGIGKKLLDAVTGWTQAQGLSSLVITVWSDNLEGLSFFTRSGFSPRCQQMELRIERANRNPAR